MLGVWNTSSLQTENPSGIRVRFGNVHSVSVTFSFVVTMVNYFAVLRP